LHLDSESGALFLPFAISTRDLLDKVKDALREEHPKGLEEAGILIPSLSWLEYQFAPANLGYNNGLRNSGMSHLCSKDIFIVWLITFSCVFREIKRETQDANSDVASNTL